MWFNDYYKATSYKFGLPEPGKYRTITVKHDKYLVVHGKKCKQCKKLPHNQQWTGTRICACGNPFINNTFMTDRKHENRKKEWRKVESKGLRDTVAAYRKADSACSTARLQDRWTQELQDERERWWSMLTDRGVDTKWLG